MGRHPNTVELDELRTGLLDRDPNRRAAITAHLKACAACQRQEALWPRLLHALDRQAADDGVAGALAVRRHRALHGSPRVRSRSAYLGLAVAAAVTAIAIGIGTVFLNETKAPEPIVAAVEAPGPDLYADLDFYLWLVHKRSDENTSPNS
jgi:anti-sigma factor RsiW